MGDSVPRTVDEIYDDYQKRRAGLLKALTVEVDEFYQQCDPERENLCLYGESTGTWSVDLPADEVPPELPEPCLGINFARDGMQKKDWLALVAVHSDAWLMAVAFYYAVRLDVNGRARLFKLMNQQPTLFEVVTQKGNKPRSQGPPNKRRKHEMSHGTSPSSTKQYSGEAQAKPSPLENGRLLQYSDIIPTLRGRQAELFWPDDHMWYRVEIQSINPRARTAKIQYTSGEVEELDLNEIIKEGHMSLIDEEEEE